MSNVDPDAAKSALVQVIVVAYNSVATLQRCIDALEAQSLTDWEAIVWDNNSVDDAIDKLRAGSKIRLVRSPVNLGFAGANNKAAELSRSEYIAFLNPDAFAEPEWLERLVAAAQYYGAEAVASVQLDDRNPEILDGLGDCMSIAGFPWRGGYGQPRSSAPKEACEVFSACAAAALYRRSSFELLKGFEESYFCYCEDVDLGFRLRLIGGRCVLEPLALVRHIGGTSSGGNGSAFAEFYGTRNRIWTVLRNMPVVLLPITIPANILITAYALIRQPRLRRLWREAIVAGTINWRRWKNPTSNQVRLLDFIRALSWSPIAFSRRKSVTRPIRYTA